MIVTDVIIVAVIRVVPVDWIVGLRGSKEFASDVGDDDDWIPWSLVIVILYRHCGLVWQPDKGKKVRDQWLLLLPYVYGINKVAI